MLSNILLAQFFNQSAVEFIQYLNRQGPVNPYNPSEWATEVEIYFMSHLLKVDIIVYKNQPLQGWHRHSPNHIDSHANSISPHSIYLVNTNNDHYDVVFSTSLIAPFHSALINTTPPCADVPHSTSCYRPSLSSQTRDTRHESY